MADTDAESYDNIIPGGPNSYTVLEWSYLTPSIIEEEVIYHH
jgi:hypothetical protein